jgi:hypothetical protein
MAKKHYWQIQIYIYREREREREKHAVQMEIAVQSRLVFERCLDGTRDVFMSKCFVIFLSPSRQTPGWDLDYAITTSFRILSNSSFTNHLIN